MVLCTASSIAVVARSFESFSMHDVTTQTIPLSKLLSHGRSPTHPCTLILREHPSAVFQTHQFSEELVAGRPTEKSNELSFHSDSSHTTSRGTLGPDREGTAPSSSQPEAHRHMPHGQFLYRNDESPIPRGALRDSSSYPKPCLDPPHQHAKVCALANRRAHGPSADVGLVACSDSYIYSTSWS